MKSGQTLCCVCITHNAMICLQEAAKKELEKKAADAKKKKNKPKPVAKSLVILEVKPWGPEIDLDKLGKKIIKDVKMDGL